MTVAQNRGAQARRELGLHGQVDAETAANRPGLQVRVWPFRALASLLMASTRPPLPAGNATRNHRARERHLTWPPLADLSLPTMPVGNALKETQTT